MILSLYFFAGWIAIFGAVVLLLLADVQDMETILHKIEWGTLLFFAALFILMEVSSQSCSLTCTCIASDLLHLKQTQGLGELGLIQFIGDRMVDIINLVTPEHQMTVALVVIVCISAVASAFIDNTPFVISMIPAIVNLSNSRTVCVALRPLVWALAFGACLGGEYVHATWEISFGCFE